VTEITVLTSSYRTRRESNKKARFDLTVPEFAIYEEEVNIMAIDSARKAVKQVPPQYYVNNSSGEEERGLEFPQKLEPEHVFLPFTSDTSGEISKSSFE
jgi:hypothetical protein